MEVKIADTRRKSIVVVTNLASPYRISLFERAAERFGSFTVIFQLDGEPGRNWVSRPKTKFEAVYLGGKSVAIGGRTVTLCRGVGRILNMKRPSGIVSCGFSLTTAQVAWSANRLRIPLVLMNDGIAATDSSRGLEASYRRIVVGRASGFIASCRLAAEYFELLGAPPEYVHVVELTTDLMTIREKTQASGAREDARRRLNIRGPVIAYVGRFVRDKRIEDLLDAFAQVRLSLPTAELILVGDGPLRARLESRAASIAPNGIRFLGMLEWSELLEVYAAIDVLAFPATRERFGMVIIEALAAGVPVVATQEAGATLDLIQDGKNGCVIGSRNASQLAEKLTWILEEPGRRERMGALASEVVEKHDVRVEAERFVTAIAKSISRESVR